jgi:hypothetical protein
MKMAFVIKNNKGLYNIIAENEDAADFIWDNDITEGWSAALNALCNGFLLIPPPPNIDPKLKESPLVLGNETGEMNFNEEQLRYAETYAETYLE